MIKDKLNVMLEWEFKLGPTKIFKNHTKALEFIADKYGMQKRSIEIEKNPPKSALDSELQPQFMNFYVSVPSTGKRYRIGTYSFETNKLMWKDPLKGKV